ncbi:MoaD/ThiS family protein [Croceicoccus gelatinilyticus]|uniref:MoaD/ThiS family protein n=1 Tax=Croceicoccus gelatinilyticus TaxID=2835536 RepID=UPI001BD01E2B|nr:MoaD/ThiS family protein [Croceicoccus gelatinilyticus]MBS7668587.1 MoaD/ThiS family protein [Croceicoccus gelatinilyticus]
MALTLLFLGKLEDVAGTAELSLDVAEKMALPAIAERLDPDLAVAIASPDIRIAQNGSLVAASDVLAGDGDELAFLPPVSGG